MSSHAHTHTHDHSHGLVHDSIKRSREGLRAVGLALAILTALLERDRTVEQLAAEAELSVSATSHHLRLLRTLRLVRARREGRHVRYVLHDHHIADLLAAIRHHHEHVHPPAAAALPGATDPAAS